MVDNTYERGLGHGACDPAALYLFRHGSVRAL
jgi:hypothetical protein